jgi:hypothetical protein
MNQAKGYLITDWGDNGHWQTLPISFLGLAMGAAYSWCVESNRDQDIKTVVSYYMFEDESGAMGNVVYELGNLYRLTGRNLSNQSFLFWLLQTRWDDIGDEIEDPEVRANLGDILHQIDQIMENLTTEEMARPDADIIRGEINLAADMLRHACRRGLLSGLATQDQNAELRADLEAIIAEFRRIWLLRNRPGGLEDSVRRFEKMLEEYA